MNKARSISFTIVFLFVSFFAVATTHNKCSDSPEKPKEPTKQRASTGIGINLLDLFMLRPVKQDTAVIRQNDNGLIAPKED